MSFRKGFSGTLLMTAGLILVLQGETAGAVGYVGLLKKAPGNATEGAARANEDWVDHTLEAWAEPTRALAQDLIGRYGLPDEGTRSLLLWSGCGHWKRTVVRRAPNGISGPLALEQAVGVPLSEKDAATLVALGFDLYADLPHQEIVFLSDREDRNYLMANLALEVLAGHRTARAAKAVYARLAGSHRDDPADFYLSRLLYTQSLIAGR